MSPALATPGPPLGPIPLPPAIQGILARIEAMGHEAYVVGGAARAILAGQSPLDWDVVTTARPHEVERLFATTRHPGLRYGTVTVVEAELVCDVTTMRREAGYSDARHPDEVHFTTDLGADLRRRDFTVDAVAITREGKLIDPEGGQADLAAGVLRAVGSADRRLTEDALRILRAVRLLALHGLVSEPSLELALRRHAPLVARVAAERRAAEWARILETRCPDDALARAEQWGVRLAALPTLGPAPGLDRIPTASARRLAWTILHRDRDRAMWELGAPRAERALVRSLPLPAGPASPAQERRAVAALPDGALAMLRDADPGLPAALSGWGRALWDRFNREGRLDEGALAVTPQDLMASLGLAAGPWLGRTLDALLESVWADPGRNERATLVQSARRLLAEEGIGAAGDA